ncbi:MAG: hypothetical protein LAP38_15985 [Acidobacteriia bacterium]|nr:hypothetical protein [Terriglobia bacterium]
MGKINISRVILGGIVAGIVFNILGYLVDGLMLAPQWAEGMKALGKAEFSVNQIVGFNIIGFANGIFAVWLYAAIRPRYGAGPGTAVFAGLMVWAIGVLLPDAIFMGIFGLFPSSLIAATTGASIVTSVVSTLAGAAIYKEASAETPRSMAARV